MQHRISAGVIAEQDGSVLLVRHVKAGAYDFWVAPGGGVQGTESLEQAAARELLEETGLVADVGRLLYVEEFYQPGCRHIKFWFAACVQGGDLDWTRAEAAAEHIAEAAWHRIDELHRLTVFPEVLTSRYASDRQAERAAPVFLPLRAMSFW